TIVYNGELYNAAELAAALAEAGVAPTSRSDTEIALLSWALWGDAAYERLNGIFAFAIWSHRREQLALVRDRLGVKPLYYAVQGELLAFASEPKAILTHPDFSARIDSEGIAELLFIGPARTPGLCVYKDMRELRPGHVLTHDRIHTSIKRCWQLQARPHDDDLPTTVKRVRDLLEDAVQRQLVSDVPIVTLLSGGLDSSAVTALAARSLTQQGAPLSTFSIDFADMERYFEANAWQTSRDAPFVHIVAQHLHTRHREVIVATEELNRHQLDPLALRDLPGMADIDTSLLLFCRQIKREATVALSGEAADEVFGGYPWFHRQDALAANTFPWSLQLRERVGIAHPDVVAAVQPEAYVRGRYEEALAEVPRLSGESAEEARIREISYLSISRFLATLLERKDRMSMGASLEVRVPFCDHRLVEYVFNIPWRQKMAGGQVKGVLREAVRDVLPEDVVDRRKSPYPSTPHPGYLSAMRDRLSDVLADPSAPVHQLIDSDAVRARLRESRHKADHRPWFGQIMATPQLFDYLLQIDHWLRTYSVSIV
ncbi:MAG: asparagine synthase (glutamine-hydrolyzing), partial [Firmicutes bacterium]|nr:asparagine synthase (glutamine-hydrolyzing) [Bacillota bacterium]